MIKLSPGFGETRNITNVVLRQGSFADVVLGEMHKLRRSGWRGGPSYQFIPNDTGGARFGIKVVITSSKAREILKAIAKFLGEGA